MEEDTEYIKLPVEERCVHKVWKARVHGYEEATKMFRQASDEKSPEFNKFLGLVKKFVTDSNAVAQEKGLEATLAFVENAAVAGRTVGEVVSGIVNKCIAAPKTKTKDLSLQIILMYIEIEKQEIVMEELIKGCDHKTPKNVAACVNAITCALREFGEKVVAIKPLLKKCPSLLEHKDKAVRDEGKALMIEMFRWIGPALRPQLSSLKPVQVTELEAEFEKLKGERATPLRYLKSQQARQAEVAMEDGDEADGDGGGESGDEGGADIDPYDLLDPVDILSKLPKNFYEKVEEKKWQERKEAVDTLEKLLTDAPKLEPGDYADVVKVLKKMITKDSNVVVVGVACKCLALLAAALQKKFHPYASACLPACLEKFKEKKMNVVTPLRDAVDAIYVSTTLEAIVEDVLAALENKNPQVKAESISFLGRCFTKCTPLILNKKLLKTYVTALLKTLNESDPTVRENSMIAIGTAMKVVGEKAIGPFLEDVNDANRMTKIKEYCDKAVLCVKQPKPAKERPSTAPGKSGSSGNVPKVVRSGGATKVPAKPAVNTATITRKPAPGKSAGAKVVKSGGGGTSGGPTKSSSGTKLGAGVPAEKDLSEEEVEERAADLLPSNIVADLTDANWKTRLGAMEQLLPIVQEVADSPGTAQVLIRVLNKKPGFKDNNFQVLKLRLECVKVISEKFKITSTTVDHCLTDIAAYLGDTKNGPLAAEVLTSLAEATRLDFVSSEVLNFAFTTQKSPKVQQEALTWLSRAILEFGFVVEPKTLMENVKKAVAASNPQVRTACISLLGTLYLYMGRNLGFFFENEKPALVQQINAEFEKHEGESPPVPTRGITGSKSADDVTSGDGDEEESGGCPQSTDFNIEDVMPRVDISGQLTEALLNELSDKNWKVKAEALGKIQTIVQEARFITPNLGEAPPLIAARLTDSNSKIGAAAVSLVEAMAPALGGPGRKYLRAFLPNLLLSMGDNKSWIRSSAVTCMNKWGETCGFKEFFDGEMIADALKTGSPILRAELWTWLAATLPEVKTVPKEELHACLLLLYNNLEDRNADVRKNAADAVPGFMIHLGYGPMNAACEKLKPASAQTVKTLLDKTRGSVPDRSGTAEKVKPKSGPGTKQGPKSGGAPAASRQVNSATMSRSKSKTNLAPAKATPKSSKKEEDIDLSPLLQVNNMKHQRVIDESKLKVLKWNFTTPREEFVELLRDQMTTANVNKTLVANMFHADFKYHLKAIESLNEDLQHNIQALTCNLDLILKWMTLRFFDTNPSVLLKGLEYLNHVLAILIEENYRVSEQEASSFLPYLILKIGDPKDTVRASVRQLFRNLGSVYPLVRLFAHTMDGLRSKNARQRAECLDLLGWLVSTYGASVIPPPPGVALKEMAKQIGDRDNAVRSAALNAIVAVHYLLGDKIFRQLGQISEKDMSLLEERIKRASKTRRPAAPVPVATVKPTPSLGPAHSHRSHPQDEEEEEYREDEREDEEEEERNVEEARSDPRLQSILRNPLGRLPVARPISGPYTLDLALLETIEREAADPSSIRGPRLKEFDLTYLKDPVPMPSSVVPNGHISSPVRNMSTIGGNHSNANINIFNTLEQISSQDSDLALQALQSVETLIVTDKWSQLVPHVDMLVRNMVAQFGHLRQTEHPDLVSCYRAVFSLCMKLYNVPPLCEKVSEDPIHQILKELLLLLSEKNSAKLETLNMVLKVMNSLALRILERSDHTAAVCATFRVLFDGVKAGIERPGTQSEHFVELAWKCMWKVIKYFPEWDAKLDYVRILAEAHAFLKAYPSSWWRSQPVVTPLRTVKTVIHSMARNRKSDLIVYLNQVPGVTEHSELYYYVHKMQQQFKSDDPSRVAPPPVSLPPDASQENGNTASGNIRVTKANADALTDIFRRIGNKDETHEGLRLLYQWKQDHPESPLDLTNYSQVFQDYIRRGLRNIELEIRCEQSNKENKRDTDNNLVAPPSSSGSIAPPPVAPNDSPDLESEDSKVAYYSRRLRDLQLRAGLVSEGTGTGGAAPATPTKRENELSDLEQLQSMSPQRQSYKITSPENLSNVERLRQRLEKLKQPSNS